MMRYSTEQTTQMKKSTLPQTKSKPNMQFAVIDCGTNVFNLLIAEINEGALKIAAVHKISVQLFKGSQTTTHISEARMIRGLDAIQSFLHTVKSHQIQHIKCVATSAVRDAENGQEFVQLVREKTSLQIEVISGEEEAKLIYYGVQFSGMLDQRKHCSLILVAAV